MARRTVPGQNKTFLCEFSPFVHVDSWEASHSPKTCTLSYLATPDSLVVGLCVTLHQTFSNVRPFVHPQTTGDCFSRDDNKWADGKFAVLPPMTVNAHLHLSNAGEICVASWRWWMSCTHICIANRLLITASALTIKVCIATSFSHRLYLSISSLCTSLKKGIVLLSSDFFFFLQEASLHMTHCQYKYFRATILYEHYILITLIFC